MAVHWKNVDTLCHDFRIYVVQTVLKLTARQFIFHFMTITVVNSTGELSTK